MIAILLLAAQEYTFDRPLDPDRFVEHRAGFTVRDGVLRADVQPGNRPLLNLLPAFGRTATLEFDVRWAGGDAASVLVFTDWRYRSAGPWLGVYLGLHTGGVNFFGIAGGTASFRKGEWARVRVERDGDEMIVSVDGTEVIRRAVPRKGADVHSAASENDYGGFAIAVNQETSRQVVEFDNLKLSGSRSPVSFRVHRKTFRLSGAETTFTVLHEAGSEAWAREQADSAVPFLEFCADLYGTPPMHRGLGMVQARGAYFDKGNGFNDHGFVLQGPNPGINTHELAHNWSHLYAKRWNVEASADFAHYSWITRETGFFTAAQIYAMPEVKEELRQGRWSILLDNDAQMNWDFEKLVKGGVQDPNRASWQANVFFYLLWRILGADGFREMHRHAARRGPLTSADMKEYIEGRCGYDLTKLFDGWVFEGETALPFSDILRDGDGDGLTDLDEKIFGTDPKSPDSDGDGYGDRGEIAAGLDPTSANEASGIVIDGFGDDWKDVPVAAKDGRDDKEYDVKSVKVVGDRTNRRICIRIDFHDRLKDGHVSLDFSKARTADVDFRVNLFFPRREAGFAQTTGEFTLGGRWNPDGWKWRNAAAIQLAHGEDWIEVAVPWTESDRVGLYVSTTGDWLNAAPVDVTLDTAAPKLPGRAWSPVPWKEE